MAPLLYYKNALYCMRMAQRTLASKIHAPFMPRRIPAHQQDNVANLSRLAPVRVLIEKVSHVHIKACHRQVREMLIQQPRFLFFELYQANEALCLTLYMCREEERSNLTRHCFPLK